MLANKEKYDILKVKCVSISVGKKTEKYVMNAEKLYFYQEKIYTPKVYTFGV